MLDEDPFLWFVPWARLRDYSQEGLIVSAGSKVHSFYPAETYRNLLEHLDGTRRASQLRSLGFDNVYLQPLINERLLVSLRRAVRPDDPFNRELSAFAALERDYPDDALHRVQDSCIAIIGVGGIGCRVSETLIRAGVRHLLLNDTDIVETSNLNRQTLFTHDDVGTLKVNAARRRLNQIAPDAIIEVFAGDLLNDVTWPFSNCADVTLLTADSRPNHAQLPPSATRTVITAGYRAASAEVGPTLSAERGTICYDCFRGMHISPVTPGNWVALPSDTSFNCSGSAINALAGAVAAQEIMLFLGFPDRPTPLLGKRRMIEMSTFEADYVMVQSTCKHSTIISMALDRAVKC